MSRTLKDRPYWVIQNDRTLGTVEHHNHTVLGRVHTLVKDKGVLVVTPVASVKTIVGYTNLYEPIVEYLPGVVRERVGRTYEKVAGPSECTAHLPYPSPRDTRAWIAHPCTTEVPQGRRRYRYTSGPTTQRVRDEYYAPERARERVGMRQLVKGYATTGDVDDWDWQNYQHRHAPRLGGWWD